MLLAVSPPRSAAYDVLLLIHILVGLGVIVIMISTYVAAMSLSSTHTGDVWPPQARRYFTPGPQIVGRSIYLLPVTGFAMLGLSQGAFSTSTPFVVIGLVLWVVAAVVAEICVFAPSARIAEVVRDETVVPTPGSWKRDVALMRWSIDAVVLVVVIAAIVMLVQP